jgi:hypothetical protein
MSEEIHDTSRVDEFMAARRRAMVLHAVWRPMLAGAAGAALVIAAVWVTLPKVSYREIEVPKVTMRDVTVPNIVTRDVQVDHVVPHETVIEIPKIVTKAEHDFISRPEFETAQFKGRLVADPEGRIQFDSGDVFVPVKYDVANGRLTQDFDAMYATEPYWGDWAFCNSIPASDHQFKCLALDHDVVVDLATTHRFKGPKS